MAERPGPPVAVLVSLPGPCASHGPLRYLRLMGALLGAIHGAGKGAGHSLGVGHRVDPPRLPSAGGTHHWLARFGERASLLERPTITTEKVVDRHLLSPFRCRASPNTRVRFNHNYSFRADPAIATR